MSSYAQGVGVAKRFQREPAESAATHPDAGDVQQLEGGCAGHEPPVPADLQNHLEDQAGDRFGGCVIAALADIARGPGRENAASGTEGAVL
jgi:hypothetical protein